MAKFKVDDVVRARSGGDKMRVEKVGTDGFSYLCLEKDGTTQWFKEGDLTAANSCASSNPVVQNALAWRAKNYRAGFGWRETKRGEHGKVFRHAGGYFLIDKDGRNMSPNFQNYTKLSDWAEREGIIIDDRAKYDEYNF